MSITVTPSPVVDYSNSVTLGLTGNNGINGGNKLYSWQCRKKTLYSKQPFTKVQV